MKIIMDGSHFRITRMSIEVWVCQESLVPTEKRQCLLILANAGVYLSLLKSLLHATL